MNEFVVRSRRVVTPQGTRPAAIFIRDGKIERVSAADEPSAGEDTVDHGDLVVMPGLVDSHVHINEPGRTEWEGFETATRAAAAGGVTTIVDMPLNSIPPTTTVSAFLAKREAMDGKLWVDVGLWGGLLPDNRLELLPMLDAGVTGFKCFLVDSGVPEFPPVSPDDLVRAARILAVTGRPVIVHAELGAHIRPAGAGYAGYLKSRPPIAEEAAVELLRRICSETGQPLHVVHLSAAGALATIRRARDEGLPLTAETAPHYLVFSAEEIPAGATEFKCAPPIRDRENRERLWQGLTDGLIDLIVSDHSPSPPEMKRGDFAGAWGGIASLQFGLAAVWTEASARRFTLQDLARWMCEGPARLAGLDASKGAIAPGHDADLVVWDPDEPFVAGRIEHRHKLTPWAGRTLRGKVNTTYVRGRKVYENGSFSAPPSGMWLRRT